MTPVDNPQFCVIMSLFSGAVSLTPFGPQRNPLSIRLMFDERLGCPLRAFCILGGVR